MQLIKYANLSKLRIKKKAWMREGDSWKTFICFTDHMAHTMPIVDVICKCRKPSVANIPFGKDLRTNEHNGPNR